MFKGKIAGAYPVVHRGAARAGLAVADAEGTARPGQRFHAAGAEYEVEAMIEHRPEAPDFLLPAGRVVTLIVTPDARLFDDPAGLTGTTLSLGSPT